MSYDGGHKRWTWVDLLLLGGLGYAAGGMLAATQEEVAVAHVDSDEALERLVATEDFFGMVKSDTCGACQRAVPEFIRASQKVDSTRFVLIDASSCRAFCREMGIDRVPTFVRCVDGKCEVVDVRSASADAICAAAERAPSERVHRTGYAILCRNGRCVKYAY